MTTRRRLLALSLTAFAVTAAPASATTFCVPGYHAGCPNDGTNVAQASLETALSTNGSDGVPDRVLIGPLIVTDTDTIEAAGTDALEIVGSGPADTVLTSSDNGNQFVVNLDTRAGSVTVRDLRVTIPASFPDDGGAGMQLHGGIADHVDIESRNAGSDGILFTGGGTFRDGEISGVAGGTIDDGIQTNNLLPGPLLVERTVISSPVWGVAVAGAGPTVVLSRVTITDPLAYGVIVSQGGSASIRDSLITSDTGFGFSVQSGPSAIATLNARNVTLVGIGAVPNAAIEAKVWNTVGHKNVAVTISDSIIRGFPDTYSRTAPSFGVGVGDAHLSFDHSILKQTGTSTGDGTLTFGTGVTDADPLFAGAATGDYRLLAGSPAIDAADSLVALAAGSVDLAGLPRIADGNGDDIAQRDLGAHEYQPPAAPAGPGPAGGGSTPAGTTPAPAGDTTRPVISGLRIRPALTARKGGRIRLTLSEPARVTLTFTSVDRRARPRSVRRTFTGVTGRNVLKIRANLVKARRYRLAVSAVDRAGNRSAALVRTVTVRR